MPTIPPLVASGSRDVARKPRPVPKPVRDAILLMVYGRPDDPDGAPVDFIEAGKAYNVKPDQMRRWLDRPNVRALLRAERRAYREAICAGNEGALRRVRDTSENGMSVVHSIRLLETLADEAARAAEPGRREPGIVIVIESPAPRDAPVTIDVTPAQQGDGSAI